MHDDLALGAWWFVACYGHALRLQALLALHLASVASFALAMSYHFLIQQAAGHTVLGEPDGLLVALAMLWSWLIFASFVRVLLALLL
jgi:hypothetical protein